MSLGEVQHSGGDDASYTGEVSASPVSLDYVRQKVREFQQTLNAVDDGYRAALTVATMQGTDPGIAADLGALLDDYESRKWQFKAAAEAINAGAATVNAMGGRVPSLSIPGSLGALPVLPVAVIAAVGTAATLIAWGVEWLRGVNERLRAQMHLDAQATPEQRSELAREMARADAALRRVESSPVNLFAAAPGVAGLIKWGGIAVAAWLAWRALEPILKGQRG